MGCALAHSLKKGALTMSTSDSFDNRDPEFIALTTVHDALKKLDRESQERILDYVMRKLGLLRSTNARADERLPSVGPDYSPNLLQPLSGKKEELEDGLDGISPVAQKWMKRNGLSASQLSMLFSLGADEIDLVANAVPG